MSAICRDYRAQAAAPLGALVNAVRVGRPSRRRGSALPRRWGPGRTSPQLAWASPKGGVAQCGCSRCPGDCCHSYGAFVAGRGAPPLARRACGSTEAAG